MSKKLLLVCVVLALALSFTVSLAQDEIPRGGIVTINESPQGNWPGPNFNPMSTQPRHGTMNFIYEPLIVFNPVDGGVPTYWLATDAQYSEDLLSLTFTLREGVKWSDGEDFNADDVVYTMNLLQEDPALDIGGIWQGAYVESVEKVDDYTVTFNLTQVFTQADTLIGGLRPLPEHVWSQIEDPATTLNETPVATGPFTEVQDFSETVYTICRNPNYWGVDDAGNQLPYVDCVRYPAFSGNDSANAAMISGDLDWAGNFIPDIQTTFVEKDAENFGFYFWPEGAAPVMLYLNTTKEPFSDVRFRRAISMSIDYQTMVDNVYGPGYSTPFNATGLSTGRFANWLNQEAIDKANELGLGTYNPEGANALLDEMGMTVGGDNFRTLNGEPFAMKIQTVNGWTDWTNAAQWVAQNLQDVGLNVTIETPEFGAWFTALQGATYDASMGWANYNRTPWDFYRNMLDSSFITPSADGSTTVANGTTWHRWTSPETDQLLIDFTSTADDAEQKAISAQLQMAYVENVVAIPLFSNPQWYEWNMQRFVGWPTTDDYYAQGSPWNQPGSLVTVLNLRCKDAANCGQ